MAVSKSFIRKANIDNTLKAILRGLIDRVAPALLTLVVSTVLTEAAHAYGKLVLGGAGTLRSHTLPAATGSGATFSFVVGAVNTSSYVVKVANATDVMDGQIAQLTDGAQAVIAFGTGATSDTITLNGTTMGGVSIGDWFELTDIAPGQWTVRGQVTASGTEATPFSATV